MITDNELILMIQKNIEKEYEPKLDMNADDWFSVEIINEWRFIINKRKEGVHGYIGKEFSLKKLEKEIQRRWAECKPLYDKRRK